MNASKRLILVTVLAMLSPGSALAESRQPIFGEPFGAVEFPETSDGRMVLPVDTHAHTVFSDGFVWPTLRANEALREKLAAFTISEHVEGQPHASDIPNPDRNRSHQIASEYAGDAVHVILGAEITRRNPPGHINAIFLEDVNPLNAVLSPVMGRGGSPMSEAEQHAELREALAIARGQGAFIIWNHPADGPDGIDEVDGKLVLAEINEELLSEGLVDGIEVANGEANIFLERALQVALDYGLTMIGASDTHGNAGESHPYFAHNRPAADPAPRRHARSLEEGRSAVDQAGHAREGDGRSLPAAAHRSSRRARSGHPRCDLARPSRVRAGDGHRR